MELIKYGIAMSWSITIVKRNHKFVNSYILEKWTSDHLLSSLKTNTLQGKPLNSFEVLCLNIELYVGILNFYIYFPSL